MDIPCIITHSERLSQILMTTKLKYTETWSIACFLAAAIYLILLLSWWREFHTGCHDWCHKNERTFRMGLDIIPDPAPIQRGFAECLDSFFIREQLIKVVTANSPGKAAAVIGCLTEFSDMFGQANSQSKLELQFYSIQSYNTVFPTQSNANRCYALPCAILIGRLFLLEFGTSEGYHFHILVKLDYCANGQCSIDNHKNIGKIF